MSAQAKSRAKKLGKAIGIALFVFLMFFNIKFALSDNSSGDIDLFGLKISIFTPSVYSKQPEPCDNDCGVLGCHIWGNPACGMILCNPGPGGYTCYYQ